MEPRKAVVKLVMRLGELFPGFNPTADTVDEWDAEVGHYSDAQLAAAGRMVARTHTFGPPSVAHIIQAIEGKVETVKEFNLDFGLLSENGRPALVSRQVRVFPDGRQEPLRIEARRKFLPEDERQGPAQIGEALDGLLAAPQDSREVEVSRAMEPPAFTAAMQRIRGFFGDSKHDPAVVKQVRAWVASQGEAADAAVEEKLRWAALQADPLQAFVGSVMGLPG